MRPNFGEIDLPCPVRALKEPKILSAFFIWKKGQKLEEV